MAFAVIQAGTSLQFLTEAGALTTLTLPTGVELRSDVPPRWTVFDQYVVLVNTPDQPLTIDSTGTVRLLCPRAPRTAAVLTGTSGGTLSGTYKVRYTFFEKDTSGRLIWESDFGATSNTITIAGTYLHAASLDVLPNSTTNGRRLYRTSTGTDVYFPWFDLDSNTTTQAEDDTSDAGISILAAPARGTPPYLTHIGEFRSRLFGVGADNPDILRYTEVGEPFAWPGDNLFDIPHVGSDERGVTAIIPRRDALGIAKLNEFLQLTGTDDTNFRIVKLSENTGVVSQESVVIYRDVAYFLWYDGVYSWDANGITCLSDQKVRSWFTKDDTFNRTLFSSAFAAFDPNRKRYILFLARAGSSTIDSWVEYDTESQTWWGPHLSSEYTPLSAFTLYTAGNVPQLSIGVEETAVIIEQESRTDGTMGVIETAATTAPFFGESPDLQTMFGELSVLTKAQPTGGELTVVAAVGEPGALETIAPTTVHLNADRQRLGRIGVGRAAALTFTHATIDEKLEIGGFEIPMTTVGRR